MSGLRLLHEYITVRYKNDAFSGPCILPDLNPFDSIMMQKRTKIPPIKCSDSPPIVFIDANNILQFNQTLMKQIKLAQNDVNCVCAEVVRANADNDVKTSDAVRCTPPFDMKSDFFKVTCSKRSDIVYSTLLTKINKRKRFKIADDKSYSVLLFGLDGVSRSCAYREIPKTVEFLKKNLSAFDLHGYMKVGDNTFPNLIPLLTGLNAFTAELPNINYNQDFYDEFPLIWKNFSSKDYVTLLAEDAPHMSTFNGDKVGFYEPPTDHYMRPYWLAWQDMYSVRKYSSGVAMSMMNYKFMKSKLEQYTLCNEDVPTYIAHLRYLKQFLSTYSRERKFMLSFYTELAHKNTNLLQLSDPDLVQFFTDMRDSDQLSNTILIVFSDHGPKTGEKMLSARLEKSLPMCFIVLPPSLRMSHPNIVKNLLENEKRLTTHYDVYATLLDILNGSYNSPSKHFVNDKLRGLSLFGKIPADRSCQEAAIPEHYCVCYKAQNISVGSDPNHHKMASEVVRKVNHLLSGKPACAILSLNKLLSIQKINEASLTEIRPDARRVIHPRPQVDTREKYTIIVETEPGGGQFYATVIKDGPWIHVLDELDRVNRYNNQSYCVTEHKLKPLCYCKVQ
ncbi:hypothetical protein ACF0H5_004955 [Mactra antiquata]